MNIYALFEFILAGLLLVAMIICLSAGQWFALLFLVPIILAIYFGVKLLTD